MFEPVEDLSIKDIHAEINHFRFDKDKMRDRWEALQCEKKKRLKTREGLVEFLKSLVAESNSEFVRWDRGCNWDVEEWHIEADEALLTFIDDEAVTKLFDSLSIWYA